MQWINDKSTIHASARVFLVMHFILAYVKSPMRNLCAFKVSNKFQTWKRTLLYPLVMPTTIMITKPYEIVICKQTTESYVRCEMNSCTFADHFLCHRWIFATKFSPKPGLCTHLQFSSMLPEFKMQLNTERLTLTHTHSCTVHTQRREAMHVIISR